MQVKILQPNLSMNSYRCRFLLLLIPTIFTMVFLFCVYAIRNAPEFSQNRILREYHSNSEMLDVHKTRTILLWNTFFGDERWSLPDDTLGPEFFRDELKCNVYQCEITNEQNFLPAVELYDAIVFHTAEPFPFLNSVPMTRHSKQFYVFALMEPPGETKHFLSDEGEFYNLTMTYRLDSDIIWPYKSIMDIETGQIVSPMKFPIWRPVPTQWNETKLWQKLAKSKTRTAAWFVSHCETLSKREKLAANLQKYIDVDIFGKCGQLSCKYLSKECDEMLDVKYKFYLSFENSLCTDYVTEKLFKALERNIIPVVFGGADYKRFVPPHSYINAEDFESVEALAEYLKYLSTHIEEYSRYFWWRRYYRLVYRSPFCDLCEKINSVTFTEKTQFYNDIQRWWLGNSCRFETKIVL